MRASISAGRSMPRPQPPARADALLKPHRDRVLTADDPAAGPPPSRRGLRRRSAPERGERRHEPARAHADRCPRAPPTPCSTRLPHPVIMIAADGRIANANAAAEAFFEASLAAAAPPPAARAGAVRQPAAGADRAGARARRGGQRIQGRSRHAAQSGRAPGRPARRAAAGARRPRGDHAAGAHHRRQDGPPAHPSRRRALGDRARRHAGARDQEPALRHPRRGAAARAVGRRRRPHADAAHLRRGRPHREAGRPHGGVLRRAAGRARAGQHPRRARAREAAGPVGLRAPHQVRRGLRSLAAAGARQSRPADPGVPQSGEERAEAIGEGATDGEIQLSTAFRPGVRLSRAGQQDARVAAARILRQGQRPGRARGPAAASVRSVRDHEADRIGARSGAGRQDRRRPRRDHRMRVATATHHLSRADAHVYLGDDAEPGGAT